MNVLRTYNGIELNEGNGPAKGLYNVSTDADVSIWFGVETKTDLLKASNGRFEELAKELIAN